LSGGEAVPRVYGGAAAIGYSDGEGVVALVAGVKLMLTWPGEVVFGGMFAPVTTGVEYGGVPPDANTNRL